MNPNLCFVCKKDIVEVQHHISYNPEKLIGVCRSCHSKIHSTNKYVELKPIDVKLVSQIYVSEEAHRVLKEARWGAKKTMMELASELIIQGVKQRVD